MNSKKIIIGILGLTLSLNPYLVAAEEVTVSGNAEGSSNSVQVNISNSSNVTQNNQANIENNISAEANTGNNTANENSGEANISTGDVNAQTQIINAGINQSYAEVGCCTGDTNIKVSGNGSNTTNSVSYNQGHNVNVTVNNNANINNSIKGSANTGYNSANKNSGNVSISTGDITVKDTIKNKSINIQDTQASVGTGGSMYINVSDNGSDSINTIEVENTSSAEVKIVNSAEITNNSEWDLNTGNNSADKNNGDVAIKTGDIVYQTTIENTDINTSIVDIDCCDSDSENPTPVDPNPPVNPPTTGGGPNPQNNPTNNGQGGVSGPILPVTGGSFSLIFLAIGNIALFFLGGYLRLRSGRSPNLAI